MKRIDAKIGQYPGTFGTSLFDQSDCVFLFTRKFAEYLQLAIFQMPFRNRLWSHVRVNDIVWQEAFMRSIKELEFPKILKCRGLLPWPNSDKSELSGTYYLWGDLILRRSIRGHLRVPVSAELDLDCNGSIYPRHLRCAKIRTAIGCG
jgi:hypothetical protein